MTDPQPAGFLLVTTVTEAGLDGPGLTALRASLAGHGAGPVVLLVLVRESTRPGAVDEEVAGEVRTVLAHTRGPAGLSRARNLALAHARAAGLLDACGIVHFADDDEAVPPGGLAGVAAAVAAHPWAGAVVGAYGPTVDGVDRSRWPAEPAELDVHTIPQRVTSATVWYRAATVVAVGDFDERFGLGARFGSGEDVDYALRARWAGVRFRYEPDVVVLHPYRATAAHRNYPGTVAFAAKHAVRHRQGPRMLFRAVRMGVREARAGAMPLRVLLRALRFGLASLLLAVARPGPAR